MRQRTGTTIAVAAAALATLTAPAAAAPKRPDLAASQVSSPAAAPGERLAITVEVRNRGTRRAGPTKLRLGLSSDRRLGAGDVILVAARRIAALRPGQRARVTLRAFVPASLPPGAYYAVACADSARKLRERRETNNCRASRGVLEVAASPSPAPPLASGPPATPAPTPTPTATPTPTPSNALDVTVEPDEARAATGTMGAFGGSLQATAADGTVFTLTFPPGALIADEPVTMTPVESVGGLPFAGGLAGGVQLAPEGLRLHEPAVLEIDPPGTTLPAPDALTFVAWSGGGEDFHLYPPVRGDTDRLRVELMHFSGYAAASATGAERGELGSRRPDSDEAAMEQELGTLMRNERECRLQGTSCTSAEELAAAFKAALLASLEDSVLPTLEAAETDDDLVASAVGGGLAWMRQVALVGLEGELAGEIAQVEAAIAAVIRAAYDRAAARCLTDDSAIGLMLMLLRQAELLGIGGLDESKLLRCRRFTLEIESEFRRVLRSDPRTETTLHVKATGMPFDGLAQPGPFGMPPDGDWRPIDYLEGEDTYYSVNDPEPWVNTLASGECELAVGEVDIEAANPRAGGQGPSKATAMLWFRDAPKRCESWTDSLGNHSTANVLQQVMSYAYNYNAGGLWTETWIPGYTHWRGNSNGNWNDPTHTDDSFWESYAIRGLSGGGGTWTLSFDMKAKPSSARAGGYDYYETTTITLRHAAAG